jgi:hypothetical protein
MSNYSNIWTPSSCISQSQLLNYIRQNLDRDEVYLVESHLNDCPICSDAIDSLMEIDIQGTEQSLTDIKSDLEQRILDRHPVTKSTPIVRMPFMETEQHKPVIVIKSTNRYRWMVAASILLFMGLGGYSIYSFIKSQDHQLAHQTTAGNLKPVDYQKPIDTDANEIRQIKSKSPVNQPDVVASTPVPMHQEPSFKNIPIKPQSPARAEQSANQNVAKRESVATANDVAIQSPSNARQLRDEKEQMAAPISQANDYMEDKKAVEPYKEALVKKSSSVGLSNSKPAAFNQRSNQLTYPHQSNNANQDNSYQLAETIEAKKYKASKDTKQQQDNYKIALQYVNAGDYKKSIPYFEKALKNRQGNTKEDIQFQLAQAYLNVGMNRKAERLFETLAAGIKYKAQSEEKLRSISK